MKKLNAMLLPLIISLDRNSGGDLIVDGAMLIKDYNPCAGNHMGITLEDAFIRAANDSVWREAA